MGHSRSGIITTVQRVSGSTGEPPAVCSPLFQLTLPELHKMGKSVVGHAQGRLSRHAGQPSPTSAVWRV